MKNIETVLLNLLDRNKIKLKMTKEDFIKNFPNFLNLEFEDDLSDLEIIRNIFLGENSYLKSLLINNGNFLSDFYENPSKEIEDSNYILNKYSHSYGFFNKNNLIERTKEINFLKIILSKKDRNNILIVGPSGAGKTTLVETLSKNFNYKIIFLDTLKLISGTKYRGEFEKNIHLLLEEVKNNEYIIFIDEIHNLLKLGGAEGGIDAANILKPFLNNSNLKIIGATTDEEYQFFKNDRAFDRRFMKIYLNGLNIEEMKAWHLGIKENLKNNYNFDLNEPFYIEILETSNKIYPEKNFPDKAIQFIDLFAAYCTCENKNFNKTNLNNFLDEYKLYINFN